MKPSMLRAGLLGVSKTLDVGPTAVPLTTGLHQGSCGLQDSTLSGARV